MKLAQTAQDLLLSILTMCPYQHMMHLTARHSINIEHVLKGGRHLREISNESIIFMSHFSIGIIDIHEKIR